MTWIFMKCVHGAISWLSLSWCILQVGEWYPSKGLVMKTASLIRQKGNNTIVNKTRIVTSILVMLYSVFQPISIEYM